VPAVLRERPQHGAIARFGTVGEIAHATLFLVAPESGFITVRRSR
jgi:hypothetical protein